MATWNWEARVTPDPEIGFLDEAVKELSDDPEFIAEGLAINFAERIARVMESKEITKAELGRRMGVSRAYTTRFLDAPPNLTLLSIAKVSLALGLTVQIHVAEATSDEESPNTPEARPPVFEASPSRPKDRVTATG